MELKTCKNCDSTLDIEHFAWKSKCKGIRQTRCKQCYAEYNRAYYAAGEKQKQKRRAIKYAKSLRDRFREWKFTQTCCVCGETASECLDLHHKDPSQKDYEISKILSK